MTRLQLALASAVLLAARSAAAQTAVPEVESEALRARVEELRDDPDARIAGVALAAKRLVPQLYERRGFAPLWTASAARDDLLRAVRDSAADGLDPEDYLLTPLQRARTAADAPGASLEAQVDCELLETDALIRLLYHLIFGKVDPTDFDPNWNFARTLHHGDRVEFIQNLIGSGDLYARIEAEKPQHAFYLKLVAELARMREIEAHGGWQPIASGPTLKPGVTDPRVPALRARLAESGDLDLSAAASGEAFDPELAAAVGRFQARHGLDADGGAGAATLAELNVSVAARIQQIRVNLERARWLLHDLAPTFVVVNVAGYEVYYVRDDSLVWQSRAQVGKPLRATPIFRSELTYLVVNPTWTVPPGIFAKDILPGQKRDRSTLAKKGLQVVDHSGQVVDESSIDWANTTPRNFRYMLRQPAGPNNALGRVKFMFPNSHSVYLHDTPSKSLFEKGERAFSSGCIRVEKPLELAALLLEGQAGWDRAALDRAVTDGATRTIALAKRVPVLLSYWTAWVDGKGALQLRRDVYGRDAKIAAGLAAPFAVRTKTR
ncbi:MAG: murein L,D-transpeptidase [Myxococcota bacterium]